ncbi:MULTISPECIES: hypothetical protein [Thermoactinomyces]|jgi:hypothetical protein|uniref:Spore germination protein n=1 Tax=Thermoactinomyces daqus TaxID=1329516 RepID=A0A7W1X7R7_9BACL|nr:MULTISPECIES: hypothetical protein [Thermoactinomyces]MBA4541641.1 hypothetical protein [Thermoactinomyces daqus]MBH8597638.1 hypothetical protein [Thermoactinomyces sp. CICC 10523]MBH8603979.1 hypothetical protein [Thermoactinomyces sp. CICC 10522]MBH8606487.1 hypothetical protein [Thermoactinomyces sp. CICC 10521]
MAIYVGSAEIISVTSTANINVAPCTVSLFSESSAKSNGASSTVGDALRITHIGAIIDPDVLDSVMGEVKPY